MERLRKYPRLYRFLSRPFVQFLQDGIRLYLACSVAEAAAALAYFVLLTVFPVLICVSYLLGLADINVATLMVQLAPFLPQGTLELIGTYLRYVSDHQNTGFFVAGLIGCWFSASAAYRTISQVILQVYDSAIRAPLRNLLASILFPPVLVVALYLSVLVVITGERTLRQIALEFPFLWQFLNLWDWLRFVLLFLVFLLLILGIFQAASPKGTPRRPMLISSMMAAVALVLSSGLFSWVIGLSSRYSLVYGSLLSVVLLMVWMYICGQIVFLAIVFTGTWHRRHRPVPPPPDEDTLP